jgi:hypothetical protein
MAAGINISDLAAEKSRNFLAAEKRAGQGLRLKGCGSDRRYITRAYPSRIKGAFFTEVMRPGTSETVRHQAARVHTATERKRRASQRFFIVKVDPPVA